jgi:flagellin
MDSILNNAASLSALQALNMTQQSLSTVQNEVSTGLRVSTAADNSSYWSIAAELNAANGVVGASNDALSTGQSVLATASSAINSVMTTINSIQTALTQATNPGADLAAINTSLKALGQQLTDAVNGASFSGVNVLNGSMTSTLQFVSGFNATATGGSFNTIAFTAQALNGLATGGSSTSTTSNSTITDAPTISALQAQYAAAVTAGDTSAPASAPTYGVDNFYANTAAGSLEVQSMALDGTETTTTYTALDANGNTVANDSSLTFANAASLAVQTTVTTPGSQNLLTQNSIDLTNLQVGTAGNPSASAALTAANQALAAVTNYAAVMGATQDRMTTASTFNSALMTDYSNGAAGLVDADMNTASTRLQALQTQEQLGIQSLSIANQNAGLVLKLFQ